MNNQLLFERSFIPMYLVEARNPFSFFALHACCVAGEASAFFPFLSCMGARWKLVAWYLPRTLQVVRRSSFSASVGIRIGAVALREAEYSEQCRRSIKSWNITLTRPRRTAPKGQKWLSSIENRRFMEGKENWEPLISTMSTCRLIKPLRWVSLTRIPMNADRVAAKMLFIFSIFSF